MRTFRGNNPEISGVRSHKSQPSKKKLRKLSDIPEVQIIHDDDDNSKDYSMEDTSKQFVLYNPEITHDKQREAEATEPIDHSILPHQRFPKTRYGHGTVLPSIGAYTVQCAHCFKWRVVPTKEKYEELRESIFQELFVCARAHEWNRVLSCDDPEDMSQDGSRVWAIDKPNIAQPPPGWDREVRIRGEGCSKFADVYYTSPSGTKLRSMVEIGRYLAENPHYTQQGVNLSQFSFATPKPLQEDYIKKCTYTATRELPELPEPVQVNTRRELLELGTSASNPVDLDHPSSASDPIDLDQPEVFEAPALHTKKRTLKRVSSSSSKPKKRTPKRVAASSSVPKKRTPKQVSSPTEPKKRTLKRASSSRHRPTTPPSWSLSYQPERFPSNIEHVLL